MFLLLSCSVISGSFATPWTSPPGSSVHGIVRARLLEWIAISSSRRYLLHLKKKKKKRGGDFVAAAAKSLQSCPTLCDPIDGSPPGSPHPWDSPGKNTGVGCHFLLQCMKVKSESEVAQLCLPLSDAMDCSPPGSSVHGILQARVLEWGAIACSARMHYLSQTSSTVITF